MSTETPAAKSLRNACKNFLGDLEAIPEDVFTKSFGGAARRIVDIVYEVNLVNDHVGMVVRGEEPFTWPEDGWIIAPETINSKADAVEAFRSSSNRIVETMAGYSQAELDATFQTEDGETTRTERTRFMTLHLWYHGGQLNFIQSMLGDTVWHWG